MRFQIFCQCPITPAEAPHRQPTPSTLMMSVLTGLARFIQFFPGRLLVVTHPLGAQECTGLTSLFPYIYFKGYMRQARSRCPRWTPMRRNGPLLSNHACRGTARSAYTPNSQPYTQTPNITNSEPYTQTPNITPAEAPHRQPTPSTPNPTSKPLTFRTLNPTSKHPTSRLPRHRTVSLHPQFQTLHPNPPHLNPTPADIKNSLPPTNSSHIPKSSRNVGRAYRAGAP